MLLEKRSPKGYGDFGFKTSERVVLHALSRIQTNPHPDPTLTLPFSKGRGEPVGGALPGSPNSDPRRARSTSPLPARSGERIKVRGGSDCILASMRHGSAPGQSRNADRRPEAVAVPRPIAL